MQGLDKGRALSLVLIVQATAEVGMFMALDACPCASARAGAARGRRGEGFDRGLFRDGFVWRR